MDSFSRLSRNLADIEAERLRRYYRDHPPPPGAEKRRRERFLLIPVDTAPEVEPEDLQTAAEPDQDIKKGSVNAT